jgi:hypothetical protein
VVIWDGKLHGMRRLREADAPMCKRDYVKLYVQGRAGHRADSTPSAFEGLGVLITR